MKELNAVTGSGMESVPLMLSEKLPENAAPDQRLQQAEAKVRRLTRCIEMKDRQLCELRKALAHSATVHYSFEDRLQRELDSLRIMMPLQGRRGKPPCTPHQLAAITTHRCSSAEVRAQAMALPREEQTRRHQRQALCRERLSYRAASLREAVLWPRH